MCLSLGLDLFQNTKALKLLTHNNHISGLLVVNKDSSSCVLRSTKYVLCCGALGTPRLLFNSRTADCSTGLANSSGLVGRNLMLHPLGYAEGYFRENISSNFGPQGCCLISQEFYRTDASRGFSRGYTIQSLRGPLPIESSLNLFRRNLLKLGPNFWSDFLKYYNHTAHLSVICEDLPETSNFLSPDFDHLDHHGMCSLNVTYSLSDNSRRMLSHGVNNLRRLLTESGAYKTFGFGPVRATGWHSMGTCVMGLDPRASVVNQYGRSHDHPNLFIFDSSIFPTSSGVNPASTIQALSLYLSDHLSADFKR